jgi:hypothetical protein
MIEALCIGVPAVAAFIVVCSSMLSSRISRYEEEQGRNEEQAGLVNAGSPTPEPEPARKSLVHV